MHDKINNLPPKLSTLEALHRHHWIIINNLQAGKFLQICNYEQVLICKQAGNKEENLKKKKYE